MNFNDINIQLYEKSKELNKNQEKVLKLLQDVDIRVESIFIENKEERGNKWKSVIIFIEHEDLEELLKRFKTYLKMYNFIEGHLGEFYKENVIVTVADIDLLKFLDADKRENLYKKQQQFFKSKYNAEFLKYPALKTIVVSTEKEKLDLLARVDLLTLAKEYYEILKPYDPKGIFSDYKAGDVAVYSEEEIVKEHGSMADFYGVNLY